MKREMTEVDLMTGLNRDWAELLTHVKQNSLRHSLTVLANERELQQAVRIMNLRHKIRVGTAIARSAITNDPSDEALKEPRFCEPLRRGRGL